MHFQFTLFSTRVHLSILNCMVNRGRSVQKPLHLWNLHLLAKVQPHLSWGQQRWRPQNPTHWVEPLFMEEVVMISPRADFPNGQPLHEPGFHSSSPAEGPSAGELSLHLGLLVKVQFFDVNKADSPHVISTACPPGSSSLQVHRRSDPGASSVWWWPPTHVFQWSP